MLSYRKSTSRCRRSGSFRGRGIVYLTEYPAEVCPCRSVSPATVRAPTPETPFGANPSGAPHTACEGKRYYTRRYSAETTPGPAARPLCGRRRPSG